MIMNFPGRTGAARGAGNVVGVMLVALILTLLAAGTRASLRSAAVVSSLDQEAAVRDALLLPQQQELLPQPNCSAPTPKLLNDQKCGPDCWTAYINPSEMFAFCGDYSKNISEIPSPACCAGVLNASTYFAPRCFCRYIFMPAAHMGIIPARRLALPELCNVTKFCDICSNLKPACGSSPLIIVASVVGGSVVCVIIAVLAWFFYRRKKHRLRFPDTFQDIDDIMRVESRPTLFSYSVLKKATKNFHISNKLGEGGFGSVFKGVLTDGTEVAVKQLSVGSKQGNDEFLNEVVLITSVQHRNLVKLQGCCLKGDERILVYEFLPNKSLHQALFDEEQVLQLDWLTRMKIILGTAQGLAYLHEGCRTRIIHRDIKASNILLDEDYNPKIADFGLARFFLDSQTHVSTRVAGTKGYLAPEYALRGQLTEKADVFSFGVVVLELISGRSNFDLRLPSDTAYLLDWTWDLHKKKMLKDVIDRSLVEDPCYSEEDAIRVVTIALLCTQSDATKRPIMSRIVAMLSRDANIEIPEIIQNSKPPELELTELPDVGGWNEASKLAKCDVSLLSEDPASENFGITSNPSCSVSCISAIQPR